MASQSSNMVEVPQTLVVMAAKIAEVFPALKGHSYALSEIIIDSNFVPANIPSAFVALEKQVIDTKSKSGQTWITENFIIEFWLKSQRSIDPTTGAQQPYWAFYNYKGLRDALLLLFRDWVTPDNSKIALSGLDVEATDAAVIVNFAGSHSYRWCAPEVEGDEGNINWSFTTSLVAPPSYECECTDCEPEKDTCQDVTYKSSI